MNPAIVTFEDLKALSRRNRPSDVERWAKDRRIPFERGGDNTIWTTVDALNAHLMGGQNERKAIEF